MRHALAIPLLGSLLVAACASEPTRLDLATRIPADERGRGDQQIVLTVVDPGAGSHAAAGSSPSPYGGRASYDGSAHAQLVAARIARDYGLRRVAAWPISILQLHCIVYEVKAPGERDALVSRLRNDPRVESAQPMVQFETRTDEVGQGDPLARLQTANAAMHVPTAHQWSTGRKVRVAIIDTGMDRNHPDLAGRIERSWNLVDGDALSFDADRHGTAVAGVLAATADNGVGIVGIAPDVEILAFKSCWQAEAGRPDLCNTLTLAAALDLAMTHEARIINLSLTGPADPLLSRLVAAAMARGIVVVGPDDEREDRHGSFPGAVDGVLAVRNVDDPVRRTEDRYIAAPGRDVLTLVPGGRFDYVSGVSFSTAMVSGVVALILERESMSPRAVARLLATTTGALREPGTGQSIDACRALASLVQSPICGTPTSLVRQH